ncbi:MAG: HlyD family efflux transporter periplasmic adaptor subunit [Leeuwenhoekiella sp.]
MRKIILTLLGVVILAGAIFLAIYLKDSKTAPQGKIEKVVKTVFVDTVRNGIVPIVIPANGSLLAKNRLELYAEVEGVFRSSSNDFKAGQNYRNGETLLNLDSSEYYSTVQAAKSEFYNLVTSIMPDLRLDYPDIYPKWQDYLSNFDINKSTPELPKVDNEQEGYFITGRGVFSSYYNVKNQEQRLGKYRISAPFSGVLTEALVTRGTLVRPGQKLGEFIDPSVYELEVAISKSYSDLLKIGEKVKLADLDGYNSYTGTVSRINGRVNQATQTIKVFVEVPGDNLKEGMYLEAQLEAKEEQNAIKIARRLLVDNSQIYIVRDSILDIIEVNPVYFSDKEVVLTGIPDGTHILSRNIPGAYAGMKVQIYQEEGATTIGSSQVD